MARTAITAQTPLPSGTAVVYEPANVDGNSSTHDSPKLLHVKNGSGSSINVTLPTVITVGGLALPSRVVAVPAGQERFIRLDAVHRQDSGLIHINYSAVATVTVAVLNA